MMKSIFLLLALLSTLNTRAQVRSIREDNCNQLAQFIMSAPEQALTETALFVQYSIIDSLPSVYSYDGVGVVINRQSGCRTLLVFLGDSHWQMREGYDFFVSFNFDSCQVEAVRLQLSAVREILRLHLWCGPKQINFDQVVSSDTYPEHETLHVVSLIPELNEVLALTDSILSLSNKSGVERIAMGKSSGGHGGSSITVYLPETTAIVITPGHCDIAVLTSAGVLIMISREDKIAISESPITLGSILEMRAKLGRILTTIRCSKD